MNRCISKCQACRSKPAVISEGPFRAIEMGLRYCDRLKLDGALTQCMLLHKHRAPMFISLPQTEIYACDAYIAVMMAACYVTNDVQVRTEEPSDAKVHRCSFDLQVKSMHQN